MSTQFVYPKTNFEFLLNCLKPYPFDPSTQEIKFKCGIVLIISQIRGLNGVIAPPMRVLSYRHHNLRSSYLLWEDNTHSLWYIGWPRVRCRGSQEAEKISDVQRECSMDLDDANGREITVYLTDPKQHKKNVTTYWKHQTANEIDWNPRYDLSKSKSWCHFLDYCCPRLVEKILWKSLYLKKLENVDW